MDKTERNTANMRQVTLANGERWERRAGGYWHMLGGEDYSPIADEHFDSYRETMWAQWAREFRAKLEALAAEYGKSAS